MSTSHTNEKERRERRARIFKALGDPTRLQMVELLARCSQMSGTEIAEGTGITLALLCHHWTILADAGIIKKWKEGQSAYCSLNWDMLLDCLASLRPSVAACAELAELTPGENTP
ncbi:MAG: metalloregulator ArsR/SmtB family transcription factor [Armatimonadota bacterium]|nr:metalloregulator ArsR/SmtB family transcription factor [Armatimonadota bacterium]